MIFLKKANKWISAVIAMILVCALTTGCAFAGTSDNAGTTAPSISLEPTETTPDTEGSTAAPETTQNSIKDSFQSTREEENLWYVPNSWVENSDIWAIYSLCGNLLLESASIDEKHLILVSSKDGSTIAEYRSPAPADTSLEGSQSIQVIADHVVVFNEFDATIEILNASLETVAQYPHPARDSVYLYLGADLKTLYVFDILDQLLQVDLESGERTVLLDEFDYSGYYNYEEGPVFGIFDHSANADYAARLDLESGTIVTAPVDGYSLVSVDSMDNVWIYLNYPTGELVYDLWVDDLHTQLDGDWVDIRLLKDQQHILRDDELKKKLYLYDVDGTFLSSCHYPNVYDYQGYDFVWNEELGGYFICITPPGWSEERGPRLYFWDISVPRDGEPLYQP